MNQPRKLSPLYLLGALLVTAALAAALVTARPHEEPALLEPPPTWVAVAEVLREDLLPTVQVAGLLQPARSSALRFELAGRLTERLVEPGQAVAAGAPLLRLEAGDYVDARARAEAQLQQERAGVARDRRLLDLARENARLQASEVARLEKLGHDSLASRSQLGDARQKLTQLQAEVARLEYAVETAEARLALRRAELNQAERNLARATLSAPFAGTVSRVSVEAGDYVSPNQSALELIDRARLDFYAEVSGESAATLALGQQVAVQVPGGERAGHIVALSPAPDVQTHTYAVRIRLAGDGLLPGTLARAELPLRVRSGVLTVPVAALLRDEGSSYVFRLAEDHSLQRLPVAPGIRHAGRYEVRGDLAVGDRIVARDVAALSDGQQVSPR